MHTILHYFIIWNVPSDLYLYGPLIPPSVDRPLNHSTVTDTANDWSFSVVINTNQRVFKTYARMFILLNLLYY